MCGSATLTTVASRLAIALAATVATNARRPAALRRRRPSRSTAAPSAVSAGDRWSVMAARSCRLSEEGSADAAKLVGIPEGDRCHRAGDVGHRPRRARHRGGARGHGPVVGCRPPPPTARHGGMDVAVRTAGGNGPLNELPEDLLAEPEIPATL